MCLTREKEIIILYTRAHAFQGTGHGEDTPDQPKEVGALRGAGPFLPLSSTGIQLRVPRLMEKTEISTDVHTSLPDNQRSPLQRKRRLLQPAGIAIVFTARVLETHLLPRSPTPPCGRCVFAGARDLLRFCPRHLPQRRACALASAGRADLVPPAECPAWFPWNWVLRDPPFLPSPPDPPDPCGPERGPAFGAAGRELACPCPRAPAEAVCLRAGPRGAPDGGAAGGGGRRGPGRGECGAEAVGWECGEGSSVVSRSLFSLPRTLGRVARS